jgi:hypothetical protein
LALKNKGCWKESELKESSMISEAEEIEGEVLKEEVFLTRVVESEKSIR